MKPDTEAELAEMIRDAQAPLRIVGGGTRRVGLPDATLVPPPPHLPPSHPPPASGGRGETGEPAVLCTQGLAGVSLYEPEALTLVVKAGTPLAEVSGLLAEHKQRLPFEPPDFRALLGSEGSPTIGGMVASNASGSRRIAAGACRDAMIGVRFVDGNGRVLKNGGRVMKNVTGYDLVKLMAGSYGTLGVITEVAFKLLPAPEASATVLVKNDEAGAVACMAAALATPFDVNGAAHAGGVTALRVEGLAGSVAYRAAALAARLGGQVGAFDWDAQRDMVRFADQSGDVWRFSVKPSDGPALARALRDAGAQEIVLDWAGGLLWVLSPAGTDLRAAMGSLRGHATLVRGTGRTFHPQPAPIAALSAGLRAQFDPHGILNPGLMAC